MIQYNTIADAVIAIKQKYGLEVFDNTPRFIALLSDYAPNHVEEQFIIRAFARAGGMTKVAGCIARGENYATMLSSICEVATWAVDENHRHEVVESIKKIVAAISSQYVECTDPSSLYAEGMTFFRRFPKEKNMPVAILLFEESWECGCKDPLQYLSSAYLKGKGVQRNAEKGIHFLKLASESGNVKASLDYAEHLWKGNDVEKDIHHAVAVLKKINDSNAYYMLGDIYRENAEYEKAFEYYSMGAANNHVYAQYAVALSYATGQGVKRDMQEAKKWLRSAALLGHGDARKKLEELGEKWD